MSRLTIAALQSDLGVKADGQFGPISKAALLARFTNPHALPLTIAEIQAVADRWSMPIGNVRAVRRVEAPRGAFDDQGRPSILFERHKFRAACDPVGRFDGSHPDLSGPPYGPGGYGPFSVQYDKLAVACALDPEAAFQACSWGAFQVLGSEAVGLGYPSTYEMAKTLVTGEAAHLETFVRFVEHHGLVAKLRACRAHDPVSCQPFAAGYNGSRYRDFKYDEKLAAAIT